MSYCTCPPGRKATEAHVEICPKNLSSTANFLQAVEENRVKNEQYLRDCLEGRVNLTFFNFGEMNMKRHLEWPRSTDQAPENEWSLSDWGVAVAEEAGEVCGAIKRYNRITAGHILKGKGSQNNLTREDAIAMLKKEIGDTVTYLDLLAQEIDSSLEECVRSAFNGVSIREDLPHRV